MRASGQVGIVAERFLFSLIDRRDWTVFGCRSSRQPGFLARRRRDPVVQRLAVCPHVADGGEPRLWGLDAGGAGGLVCAPHLAGIGANLFNLSFSHELTAMQTLVGDRVALLGNLPPRDVLAFGTEAEVRVATAAMLAPVADARRLLVSVGGGMSPGTPTANIDAFLETVRSWPGDSKA